MSVRVGDPMPPVLRVSSDIRAVFVAALGDLRLPSSTQVVGRGWGRPFFSRVGHVGLPPPGLSSSMNTQIFFFA